MKTKVIAVVIGALATLILWAIAFVVLNGIYQGNFPWLLTGLAAFLCPLVGGYTLPGCHRRTAFDLAL